MTRNTKRPVQTLPEGWQCFIAPVDPRQHRRGKKGAKFVVVSGPVRRDYNPEKDGMLRRLVHSDTRHFGHLRNARRYMARMLGLPAKKMITSEFYELYPAAFVLDEIGKGAKQEGVEDPGRPVTPHRSGGGLSGRDFDWWIVNDMAGK